MSGWWSGDIVAGGRQLHYMRTGGDGPPLVLAHGMGDDGLCWSRLARALEGEYDLIMPDARGHGHSAPSDGAYDSEHMATDLAALIEALGLTRPAVGGHSMGATTALFLAALRPDLVRAAWLEDPPFWPGNVRRTEEERAALAAEQRQRLEHDKAAGREALLARGRADNPSWADEEFGPWVDSKLALDTASLPRPSYSLHWRDALSCVQAPTLLLTGDPALGAIVMPEVAREAAAIQPLLRVVNIPGAGHSIRREQFERYLTAVREFLATV